MNNKEFEKNLVEQEVAESINETQEELNKAQSAATTEPAPTGSPYWNGIEQDPTGGYRFTGQGNQNGYASYNYQGAGQGSGYSAGAGAATKKTPGWVKGLIIFAVICIGIVGIGVACSRALKDISGAGKTEQPTYDFNGDYIGVLYLEGTITEGESGDGYNQDWILARVNQMAEERNNRGIMLHINTPGGSAYATSELYDALLDYKSVTGNPIYVYMGSQATSGGYYAAMAADKIYANPECWTGSIGVVVGTLYDFSGLFEKYGVKATNIVSGENKDMGSSAKPLTEEQIAILQSLVDDSFGRFVQAVVDGRGLPEAKVRELADGRIYTAKQALDNGLIDAVGSLEEAISDMQTANGLENVKTEVIQYVPEADLLGMFGFNSNINNSGSGDLSILMQLMEESSKVAIEFICPIRK